MAFDKKRLRREIEKERRSKFRARLVELRGLIQEARIKRAEAVQAVKLDCAQKRVELRESCSHRNVRAREQGAAEVARRRGEVVEAREMDKLHRKGAKPAKMRSTSRQRAQEDDDAVRSNLEAIDPAYVPVFNTIRKHIKAGPRTTRTEAFLQWAEENPAEVFDLLQHDADRYLASLLAEQERTSKELRRSKLAGVPF